MSVTSTSATASSCQKRWQMGGGSNGDRTQPNAGPEPKRPETTIVDIIRPNICRLLPVSWVSHVLRLDKGVEFFGGDVAQFEGGFAKADVLVDGRLPNLTSLVIAEFLNERMD